MQKKVQKLERRLQKERAVAEHAAAVLEHAEKEPPHDDRLQALEASIATTLEALDGHEDVDDDELLEAEQHLADLEGLHEELVERSAKSPVKDSSSSDEAEPPAPRRATPLDAARRSPRRLPSDDDDEEGWPAPPTASDDGGRGPAYSFDVDDPPPPPATKAAPAPPSDSDDSSEGWPEPAATPAMPSKAPPQRLDTIRSDDGSDDSGDAWPDAKPVSGGYGHDDTAEGVVGITAPTGNDDDDSDSGDDWGAPSREASSSTAPVAQTSGEIHTIDDWDDEAPAPAPPKLSPLDAAVAARRAAIETDSDSSEGWPSPTAGAARASAEDMDDASDESDIESAVEQRKDSWPSDDESEDSAWGRK